MAEPTEQEQIKQTQVLEKVAKSTSETTGKLDKVISSLKEESIEKDILKDIKEQGEDKVKLDKDSAKENIQFHDKQEKFQKEKTAKDTKKDEQSLSLLETGVKADEKTLDTLTDFKEESSEADKKQQAQNQFIKEQEKKKEGLAKMAFNFQQRAAKLATRVGKDTMDWGKGKIKGVTRAVGGFLDNLMKLLALAALWLALSWLKGKDLTKLWSNFVDKLKEWADILPDWVKHLSIPQMIATSLASITAAWAVWKTALALAASTLDEVGSGMKKFFGIDAPFTKKLGKINTKIANLLKKEAALQRAIKMAGKLDDVSDLAKQLKLVNEALDLAVAEQNAVKRAQTLANALAKEAPLAKNLKLANDELLKAISKEAAAQKAFNLGKNLGPESKLAKNLASASDELAKVTKSRGVAAETLRLARMSLRDAEVAAEAARAAIPKSPTAGAKSLKPVQKMMGRAGMRWTLNGKIISATEAAELGADVSKAVVKASGAGPKAGIMGKVDDLLAKSGSGKGLFSELKAAFGFSQKGSVFNEIMHRAGQIGQDMAKGIGNAPGIKGTLKFLNNPLVKKALSALNVADLAKGAGSVEKGGSETTAAIGSMADSWFPQLIKLVEMGGAFYRDEALATADYSWSKATEAHLSEFFGEQGNRMFEHKKDKAGNLMYEKDKLGNLIKDEKGQLVPMFANAWSDFFTKTTGKSGFNAIFKNGIPLSGLDSRAIMDTVLAQVFGIRQMGGKGTGKELELVQTGGGLKNETSAGLADLGNMLKEFMIQTGRETSQIHVANNSAMTALVPAMATNSLVEGLFEK